jgi:hypothetical protein
MPVGARVHLSERIDLMAEVAAIGFVVPMLDPRNAGQMRQEGWVMKSATQLLWELVLQELQKPMVIALVEHPNWSHVQLVMWRARVGLKATECRKSAQGWTIN